jgi:hypothetical protein
MSQLPNHFQPNQLLSSKNPYKQGQVIPDPYDYQQQATALPIAAFQVNWDTGAAQNPYESPADYMVRTGSQMLMLTNNNWKQNTSHTLSDKTSLEGRLLGEKFIEINNSVFFFENGKKIPLTNFIVEVTKRVCRKSIGKSTDFLTVRIISVASETELTVPLSKYKLLLSEIKNDHPQFRLNAEFRNAYSFFSEYCSLVYEESLSVIVHSTIYEHAGWENVNGQMIYLSGRLSNCQSERYVWEVNPRDIPAIYRHGHDFLTIGNNLKTILPLFLYSHIGYTAQLFEEAGYEVQFLLMVVGKTGSFKTSLCQELFQAFNIDKFLNFQSTPRAIELQRNECRDMTMLLDDIFSSRDKDAVKKFADVLRVFGDNAAKAKANAASTKIERFDVRGAAVVTGESDLNTQQSSRLRYLTIPVDNSSFNAEKLRSYQVNRATATQRNQPSIIQSYFSAYIYFLENNYTDVVHKIMQIDHHLAPLPIKFPRLNMIYLIMVATARIVIRFGLTYGAMTNEIAETLLAQWTELIRIVILENQNDSTICEPYIAYLDALVQGIATGDILLANDKETFFQSGREYFGFYDKQHERTYLNYHKVFKYVERYYADLRGSFETTPREIHKVLYEQGLSEGYQEKGRNRYLKKMAHNGEKSQMLCLKHSAVEAALSEDKN